MRLKLLPVVLALSGLQGPIAFGQSLPNQQVSFTAIAPSPHAPQDYSDPKSYIVSKCVGNPSEEALAKCVQKDVLTVAEMEAIKGTLSSRLFFRRDAVIAAAGGVGLIGGAFLVPYVLTATGISTGGELSSLSVWSLKSIANFFNVMMGVPSVGAVIGGGAGYVITGIYGKGNLDAQNVINQAIDTKKPVIILDADPGTSVVDQLIAQVRN